MKQSLYVLVRELWNEQPWPGKRGNHKFPFSALHKQSNQIFTTKKPYKNYIDDELNFTILFLKI